MKEHEHAWQESKTYFGRDEENGYALSRYCKECGQCEAYVPKEKKWVVTGNINDELKPMS